MNAAPIDEVPRQNSPPRRSDVAASRQPEIELLRILAMVAVFAVHAAEPFNPWDAWHVQSPARSKWLGELVLLLAPWVMPLFILLAGAGAWHSLGKRSPREYVYERVTRLIIPLAGGILLLVPPQVYYDRRQRGMFGGSFLEFYPHFFDGVYPKGNFTWSHLWFLGILAVLALITLPLFLWLRTARGRRVMAWIGKASTPPGAILLLVLPMLVLRVALWAAFPRGRPVITDWSNRTVILLMFIYGFMIAGEPALRRAVDRQWKLALGVAGAFAAAMFAWAWPGDLTQRFAVPFTPTYVFFWCAYALGGLAWSIALYGAARAVHFAPSRFFARAREYLNPFYMLHQTVIVVLAFYLIDVGAGPIITFLWTFVASFTSTMMLCAVVMRPRLLRPLFGLRPGVSGSNRPQVVGSFHHGYS